MIRGSRNTKEMPGVAPSNHLPRRIQWHQGTIIAPVFPENNQITDDNLH